MLLIAKLLPDSFWYACFTKTKFSCRTINELIPRQHIPVFTHFLLKDKALKSSHQRWVIAMASSSNCNCKNIFIVVEQLRETGHRTKEKGWSLPDTACRKSLNTSHISGYGCPHNEPHILGSPSRKKNRVKQNMHVFFYELAETIINSPQIHSKMYTLAFTFTLFSVHSIWATFLSK